MLKILTFLGLFFSLFLQTWDVHAQTTEELKRIAANIERRLLDTPPGTPEYTRLEEQWYQFNKRLANRYLTLAKRHPEDSREYNRLMVEYQEYQSIVDDIEDSKKPPITTSPPPTQPSAPSTPPPPPPRIQGTVIQNTPAP